jgi:endo-alpha-1,4-polygalactosaminidase (GH114 family)
MLRPYLASKNLRWSAPAIRGRKSDLWQRKIVQYDFNQFIKELKKAGFDGVYIDRVQYLEFYDQKNLQILEEKLQSITKMPKFISANNKMVFFAI